MIATAGRCPVCGFEVLTDRDGRLREHVNYAQPRLVGYPTCCGSGFAVPVRPVER